MAADSPGDAPIHPAPVEAAIRLFADLVTSCGRVRTEWDRLKAADARTPATPIIPLEAYRQLPEGIPDLPELQKHKAAARKAWPQLPERCHEYLDCQDDMQVAVRHWRLDLDTARVALPTVAAWMDDKNAPPVKRWTADVQGELNELGGLIHRTAVGDLPQTLDTDELERLRRAMNGRLGELKRVPMTSIATADPRPTPLPEIVEALRSMALLPRSDQLPTVFHAAGVLVLDAMKQGAFVGHEQLQAQLSVHARSPTESRYRAAWADCTAELRKANERPVKSYLETFAEDCRLCAVTIEMFWKKATGRDSIARPDFPVTNDIRATSDPLWQHLAALRRRMMEGGDANTLAERNSLLIDIAIGARQAGLRPITEGLTYIVATLDVARREAPQEHWGDEPSVWSRVFLAPSRPSDMDIMHDQIEDMSSISRRTLVIEWAEGWMNARERQLIRLVDKTLASPDPVHVSEPPPPGAVGEKRRLRACVKKAGEAYDAAIKAHDEWIPEPGKAPSTALWNWVNENCYTKTKRLDEKTFRRYVREYLQTDSPKTKMPGLRVTPTRSMVRAKDEKPR